MSNAKDDSGADSGINVVIFKRIGRGQTVFLLLGNCAVFDLTN
ncbi:hypothetical protein [Serratia marcescens]|nr:hypothetical protein [Serratia marcescens]